MSPATRKQLREKWRESKRRCRERLRAIKVVLDLTPESDQGHDLSFNHDNEAPVEVPVVCSTPRQSPKDLPTQSTPKRKKSSVMKELRKLKKLNEKLTKQLEAEKKEQKGSEKETNVSCRDVM